MSEHKLGSILLIGIVARIVLMPFSAHPFDVYVWYDISMGIIRNGPFSIHLFPPLWYDYMMVPVAYAYNWLAGLFSVQAISMASLPTALNFYPSYNIQYVPGILFNSVVKFPFLISDIIATLLLYKTVQELTKDKGLAEKAAMFWFMNPFVIWISAGWGMWDTLPALFSLAAFFLLLRKRTMLSAVCLSLGVASKLYPALFLVPIAIYFFKSSPALERWKNCARFFSVFIAASALLFLPSIGSAVTFTSFLIPPASAASIAVANPIVEPVGFGLTYWSLYLLNRLISIPISAGFVSLASVASVILVAVSLTLVYWKIGKMTFQNRAFDLGVAMLLTVLALFLSFRIVQEQWFVWALPFLIIICVGGRIREALYWGTSLIALLYSVLNCPLPFFFLPLAPWTANTLLGMVNAIWTVEPFRIGILALLGCLFSYLILLVLLNLTEMQEVHDVTSKSGL